jgi:hypothetical protein
MKNWLKCLVVIVPLSGIAFPLHAQNLQVDLPYGIGSVQLPWQSTEILYGAVRSFKGGHVEEIAGASLPILTLGRLSNGYRIIDGELGAVGAWPVQSDPVDIYGAFGHDIVQDIPALKDFSSFHLNAAVTYSNALQGWTWGGTVSYAFGEPPSTTPPLAQ